VVHGCDPWKSGEFLHPGSDQTPPSYKSEVLMLTPVCSVNTPVTGCIDCICTCHYAERADSTHSLNMYL